MKPPYKKDNTPVYEVPFDNPNLVAKANKNGTIIVNKDLATDEKTMKEAMAHEKVHLKDMANGDLDYDAESVTYKGKKYSRADFDEGDKKLPWEAPAYATGKSGKEPDCTPKKEKLTGPPAMQGDMGDSHEPREQDHDTVSMNERFGTAMVKKWHGPSARSFSGATDDEASKIRGEEEETAKEKLNTTPKKRGKTIMDMSNAQIYRMEAEGKFDKNPSMKLLLNSPRGAEYKKFKAYRDKENYRKTEAVQKEKFEREQKGDETDQEKAYGQDDEFKKTTQQAGQVFDEHGSKLYPDMEGYTEAMIKAKEEGYNPES